MCLIFVSIFCPVQPIDYGAGESSNAEIVINHYKVESSMCPSFGKTEACISHEIILGANIRDHILDRESIRKAGCIYYIRVSAKNKIGWSIGSVGSQKFMISPRILSPVTSGTQRLQVVIGEKSPGQLFVHTWQGSNLDRGLDGRGRISVTMINIFKMTELNHTILKMDGKSDQNLDLSSPRLLANGRIEFVVQPDHSNVECNSSKVYPCSASLLIMSTSGLKIAELFLEISQYMAPEFLSLLPAGGPASGGTTVKFQIRDHFGAKTRHLAGLFSMEYLHDVNTLNMNGETIPLIIRPYIQVTCRDRGFYEGDFHATVIASSTKMLDPNSVSSAIYEVTAEMPKSPDLCGAGEVFIRFFAIGNEYLCDSGTSAIESLPHKESCKQVDQVESAPVPVWEPAIEMPFEYRGAGIIDVTPSSGMINVGNDRLILSIIMESIGTYHSFVVTLLANSGQVFPCEIMEGPVNLQGSSQLTQIKVMLPELPEEKVGTLSLNVAGRRSEGDSSINFGPFVEDWEFIAPPSPQIDPESILISREQRDPLWVKKREVQSSLALPMIELTISNLDPKYVTAFDELQVWFDESTSRVGVVSFASQGSSTDLLFSLNVGGMEVGIYTMVVHVKHNGKLLILRLSHVEVRDMSVPAIIAGAIAPTEGPISKGSLVLLGISGASALLNPNVRDSLKFRVQAVDDSNDFVYGTIEAGPSSLTDWTADFSLGSSRLVQDYKNVIKSATSFDMADTDGGDVALIAVRTPNWTGASMVQAFVQYDGNELKFAFEYWEADPTPQIESVSAQDGRASGMMAGGYPLLISISGFPITYNMHDISIVFGSGPGWAAQVLLIEQSNSKGTKVRALVPAGDPGVVEVMVSNTATGSSAYFSFEYVDDSIPEVESIAPFLVYADGSTKVTTVVLNLPQDLSIDEIIITAELAVTKMVFGDRINPESLKRDGETGEGVSRNKITFLPQGLSGADRCTVDLPCYVSIGLSARGKSVFFDLAYIRVPTGAAILETKDPAVLEGQCTASGQKITVVLSNLKMVEENSQLRISLADKYVLPDDVVVWSFMAETIVSFVLPVLLEAVGPTQLTFSIGDLPMADTIFECADPSVPVLIYTMPDAGMATTNITVLVGVQNLNMQAGDTLAVSGQVGNIEIEVISVSVVLEGQDSVVTKVAITMRSSVVGYSTARLNVSETRFVDFEFQFLDPTAIRITDYMPRSEYIYGGTEMRVLVDNLPADITTNNIMIGFGGIANVSVIHVQTLNAQTSAIFVQIPATTSVDSVAMTVLISGLGRIDFADHFQYLEAPVPSMTSVLPSSASFASGSRTRLSIKNFPKVLSVNDVMVQLFFGTKGVAAVVSGVSGPGQGSIQDLEIDLMTPTGPEVKEGRANIRIFHKIFAENAFVSGGAFIFVDPVKPLVVAISSGIENGISQVRTPMSGGSDISISISKAPRGFETSRCLAKLGDRNVEVLAASPSQVTDALEANLVFSTTSASNAGVEYGIIFFGDVADSCSAACCASSSCASVLECRNVQSVCFSLDFYNDNRPAVTARQVLAGPQIGGHVLNLVIVNIGFTLISDANVFVTFRSGDIEGIFESVEIDSSDADKTLMTIKTPEFKGVVRTGKTDQSVEIWIEPKKDPRKKVKLIYLVEAVQSQVVIIPSTAPASGGSRVTAEIDFFEYPTQVKVSFDGDLIPQANVLVLTVSSKIKSAVQFMLPAKPQGRYEVVVSPALCTSPCTKSVRFAIEILDDSMPEIQRPPSGGPFQRRTLPTLYIRKAPLRRDIIDTKVEFSALGATTFSESSLTLVNLPESTGGLASLTVDLPLAITAPGVFMVNLTFTLTSGTITSPAPFKFVVFDGLAPRVIQISPESVPTAVMVEGRKLNLQSTVSLLCANFPKEVTGLQDLTAVLRPSLQAAQVLEIRHLVTCDPGELDCSRTLIKLRMPALDGPGIEELVVSQIVAGSTPQEMAKAHLTFVPSCNHGKFCQESGQIVNYKKLMDNPILGCSPNLCLDGMLIGDPELIDVSPKAGGAGTQVSVQFNNLPVFNARDVAIVVEGSTSKQRVPVSNLQQGATSTLTSSRGVLQFVLPQFFSLDDFATISVSTVVGGKSKLLKFDFEYLPKITGPAIVRTYSPVAIMKEEDLNLFVTVANVHRIDDGSADQLLVHVAGAEIATERVSIISSDRTSTSLSISVPGSALLSNGAIQVGVGSRSEGSEHLGLFSVDIVSTPAAEIRSSFPALNAGAPADEEHMLIVQVAYLHPALVTLDVWNPVATVLGGVSTEGGVSVDIVDVVSRMDQDCTSKYCSVIEFKLRFPPLDQAGQDTGGNAVIIIETLSQDTRFEFTFVLIRAGLPSVVLVQPATISLEGNVPITIFLKNFPTPACKGSDPPTCKQDAEDAGLKIEFQNVANPTDVTMEESNGMLVLTFSASSSATAGDETGKILLDDTGAELEFDLAYMMPPAHVSPMDGHISGGETITISAMGWYGMDMAPEIWSASNMVDRDFSIKIDETSFALSSVRSVEVLASRALVAVVEIPVVSTVGTVSGSISAQISSNGKSTQRMSRFVFRYFKAPVLTSVEPKIATLSGKTTAIDGRSVLLTILNFPMVVSPCDVKVSFGATVCGVGAACNIIELRSFKVNDANELQVRVRVPPVSTPSIISISVEYTHVKLGSWTPKTAFSAFSFFKPLPAVRSVRWCSKCNSGRACIVMGSCGGAKAPLENMLPLSGGGTMVITLDNPPSEFRFTASTGETQARMLLALGDSSHGEFVRVAQGDGMSIGMGEIIASERVILEFVIPDIFAATGDALRVSITPVGALSPASASMGFSFFDQNILIECLQGCQGSAHGQHSTILALTNFQLDPGIPLLDQVMVIFGDFEAAVLVFANDHARCVSGTCIMITQPECDDCIFDRGALTVDLSVVMKADRTVRSTTSFTYWAAPAIVSASFNTVGTAVKVLFDQNTDMAMMSTPNSLCQDIVSQFILKQATLSPVAVLGAGAGCVWESRDSLNIFLGTGATIVPGDILVIKPDVLKSSNSLSDATDATVEVKGPEFPVAPLLSIQGTSAIDPCSELELRAVADSPRPLKFKWSCRNDGALSATLSRFTGAVLFLAQGTKEMAELDKTYEIVLTVQDFFGATSDPLVYPILKTSSAAPKLTFFPSTLSVYRDETIMVRVVAEFSKCPIKKGALVFTWSLVSRSFLRATGTEFASSKNVFEATSSQLLVPPGVLDAEATYTLAVHAYMDNDPSISSAGTFSVEVKKQELVASIRGGAGINASTMHDLVLDASDSTDPDFAGGSANDTHLHFAWMCSIVDGGVSNPCRDKQGMLLLLPNQAIVTLDANILSNLYLTAAQPYIFEVVVTKGSMKPQSFALPVTLSEVVIPAITIRSNSGKRMAHGGIKINANDQLVVLGDCSVIHADLAGMMLSWRFVPYVNTNLFSVIPDETVSEITIKREALIVAAGSGAFVAGSTYIIEINCKDSSNAQEAVAQYSLSINTPPRGGGCTSCRLLGSVCAMDKPTQGEAIFDTFRVSCMNWADDDGSLEYEFGYSSGDIESVFEWSRSRMMDFNLPSGRVSFKARVRDGFGGSTPWIGAGSMTVGVETNNARRLLQEDVTWQRYEARLQETLDLADYSRTNMLGSAISMQVDIDAVMTGSSSVCVNKKESILRTMSIAADRAIKTLDFICAALSSVATISNAVNCINMTSTQSLSDIVKRLVHSKTAHSLPIECSQNVVRLLSKSLSAIYNNRECQSGRNIPQDTVHLLSVGSFLTEMDSSMQQMLGKTSKDLIAGQALHSATEASTGTPQEFNFLVKKLSAAAAEFSGTMVSVSSSDADFSFNIPAAVRADSRMTDHADISVLFSAIKRSPVMGPETPISPVVTLTLAGANGVKIALTNLVEPIAIQIPISHDGMCANERLEYGGKGTCMYWDETTMKYSAEGCMTQQSVSGKYVTCMCNHLTSFVVANSPVDTDCSKCPSGKYKSAPCSSRLDRVCVDCPAGSYAENEGQDQCNACPTDSHSLARSANKNNCMCNTGFTGPNGDLCEACDKGKFKDVSGARICDDCMEGKYSTVEAANSADTCLNCVAGKYADTAGSSDCQLCGKGTYSATDGMSSCVSCGAGKYLDTKGLKEESDCQLCSKGKYSSNTGASSDGTCQSCAMGKYLHLKGGIKDTSCIECGAGKYSNVTGSSSGDTCLDCVAGTYLLTEGNDDEDDCVRCDKGKYTSTIDSSAATCLDCKAGKYSTVVAASSEDTCLRCVEGKYADTTGNDQESRCTLCDRGTFSSATGASTKDTCTECVAGKFSTEEGKKAISDCQSCGKGTYSATGGSSFCAVCGAGKYLETEEGNVQESDCQRCGMGKYSSSTGASSDSTCNSCVAGKYSSATGATSITDCKSCGLGKFSPTPGAQDESMCGECGAGKYSDITTGASVCNNCAAGKYLSTKGNDAENDCVECMLNSQSPEGSDSLADDCTCNFGYEKIGITCQLLATITRAELEQSSIAPGAENELTVHLQCNIVVPQGATIKIKNLLGVTTPTDIIKWNIVGRTAKQNAAWDQASGVLSITLFQEIAASALLHMQFTVRNPSTDSSVSPEVEISGWPANTGLAISKVMSSLLVCPVGYFGNACTNQCFGTVLNKSCTCGEGEFGFDCSQQPVKDAANSVAPMTVQAGVAAEVKSASGVGVSIPAGALTTGATIEVTVYNIDVKISSDQWGGGVAISPAGALGMFKPHGLKFAVPVTITLKYDLAKVPAGDEVFVYYFDENSNPQTWTQMPGKVSDECTRNMCQCACIHLLFGNVRNMNIIFALIRNKFLFGSVCLFTGCGGRAC